MRYQGKYTHLIKFKMIACLMILVTISCTFTNILGVLPEAIPIILLENKIDDELLSLTNLDEQQDIILSYNEKVSEFKVKCAVNMADNTAEIVHSFAELNMMRIKMIGKAIHDIAKLSFIEKIWSNKPGEISPLSTPSYESSSIDDYISPADIPGVREFWEQGYNGSGIVIAVLDTGVDILNPDLTVNAFASFVEADSLPLDTNGHGTYAASIAAGSGNRSKGLYSGVAPGATILAGKVTLGGLLTVPSWIVSGIEWAASHGADIILMPFNTYGAPGDAVSKAIEAVTEKGIFVVAAAGDDGPDYLSIMSPGGSTSAFTVGAYDTDASKIPAFSGRGPTFEMHAKPDIVAPGVGIVGARTGGPGGTLNLGGLDLGGLLEDVGFGNLGGINLGGGEDLGSISGINLGGLGGLTGGGGFGENINENYTQADTTAASAAILAGSAAILMQAFDRATPIVLANTFRDTAISLPFGVNDAGAGLLNLKRAFEYLSTKQEPIESHSRTPGIPLLAFGFLSATGMNADTTLMMSSYGTSILALDSRPNNEMGIHLLMGMMSLRWNNMSPTNLMMFDVKRELHQVSAASEPDYYNRWIGILSYDDELFVTLLVESYNLTEYSTQPLTAFRITPFILNLGASPISNVSLFLSYSLNLFLDDIDDHGKYARNNQQLFAYGQAENYDRFYVGLNSSRALDAFEVGNSSTIATHVSDDNLTASTTFDGTVGLAMKWDFGVLQPNELVNVTIAMGFGENRTVLDKSIESMWINKPGARYTSQGDYIVVEADIPRNALQGETYYSRAIIMNIGEEPANVTAGLAVIKELEDQNKIFLNLFQVGEMEPFQTKELVAEWRPEEEGIHSAVWIGTYAIEDLIGLLAQLTSDVTTTLYQILDDFLMRDVFVVTPIESTSVFPKVLPAAPFFMDFPSDYGLFTFSLSTTVPLGNLTVTKHGNATEWGNITLNQSDDIEGLYNFSLFLLVPPITVDGYHKCDYVIHTEHGWSTNITLEKNIKYPRAMMLLDTSHGGGLGGIAGGFGNFGGGIDLDMGNSSFLPAQDSGDDSSSFGINLGELSDLGSLDDLLSSFRMTTLSGLSEMKRIMAEKDLDLVETPGMPLEEGLLSQFSTLFIFTPSIDFNSTELDMLESYTDDGGKLVIFGDKEGRANLTVMNQLLSHFGYAMGGEHSKENTTEVISNSALGSGLECVWLGGGTYILSKHSLASVTLNGNPVIVHVTSQPEMVLFGSSQVFMNKNLVKCNNTNLLQNLNEYLLQNTLTATASLSENTTRYPVGRSVYINLIVVDYRGEPVGDLTVIIIYELPNGSVAFFIAGFVEDGLYATQFTPNYWKNAGRINGIFIILGEGYASTYASISFELYVPYTTSPTTPPGYFLTLFQVALISSIGIFSALILGLVFYNVRRKKRLRIPEVDSDLGMEIDNTLNTLLAAFMQIEELIRREDLGRVEKVEMLRVLMESLGQARKMFDKVSDQVGGV